MTALERSLADYKTSGVTVGPHIVSHLRPELQKDKILRASDLANARNGQWVKVAGLVIVRQRPGTAKGMCFITLEDETGTANAAVMPQVFQQYRSILHTAAMLIIEGPLQKVVTGGSELDAREAKSASLQSPAPSPVIHVLARRLSELHLPQQAIQQVGQGYRMRTTPQSPASNNEQPDRVPPSPLPKSHDFR